MIQEKRSASIQALIETNKNVWTKEISVDTFNNLIRSLHNLIQTVIKKHGGHTKFWPQDYFSKNKQIIIYNFVIKLCPSLINYVIVCCF